MKKIVMMAAGMLLAGAVSLAQPGGGFGGPGGGEGFPGGEGGFPGGGMPPMEMGGGFMGFGQSQLETNEDLIAAYSDYMVEKYKLDASQAEQVRNLNKQYTGKVSFAIPRDFREKYEAAHPVAEDAQAEKPAADTTARKQFRNMQEMTDEEREEMMAQMRERMEEANAAAEELEEATEAYEGLLESIMGKSTFKKYKKDVSREEEREERRQQGEMRRNSNAGGFGGFPGGDFGGGF